MTWDDLGMKGKAAFMGVAIMHGLTDLGDIRQAYNAYAQEAPQAPVGATGGANLYQDGGDKYDFGSYFRKLQAERAEREAQERAAEEDFLNRYSMATGNPVEAISKDLVPFYRESPKDAEQVLQNIIDKRRAAGIPVRIRNNTSRTAEQSQHLENVFAQRIAENHNGTVGYAIPWGDEVIKVDNLGTSIPTNALDSLAKYAGMAGIPLKEAVGLAFQETRFGRVPYGNIGDKGVNATELMNANYFKNFGSIPAESIVRDFAYNNTDRSLPPLFHAFTYYNAGKYNRGEGKTPSGEWRHTAETQAAGDKAFAIPGIQQWGDTEGKRWYAIGMELAKKAGRKK